MHKAYNYVKAVIEPANFIITGRRHLMSDTKTISTNAKPASANDNKGDYGKKMREKLATRKSKTYPKKYA